MEVSAKLGKDDEPVTVNYALLDAKTLKECAANFGEEITVAHCKSSITVALQSFVRGLVKQGKSKADIQKAVNEWKPSTRTPGKSRMEKAEDLVTKLSEDERKALLRKLQGKA